MPLTEFGERLYTIALDMVNNKLTLRKAAMLHGVPKSTIHYWIHKKLSVMNEDLYNEVLKLFEENCNRAHKLGYYKLYINRFINNTNMGEYIAVHVDKENMDKVTTYLTDNKIPFESFIKEGVIKCCRL